MANKPRSERSPMPVHPLAFGAMLGVAAYLGLTAHRMAQRKGWLTSRGGYSFYKRSVIITGGSRGLGLIMARQLIREGARLSLMARDQAELARAREQVAALGGQVHTVAADVANEADVNRAVRSVLDHYGHIDVVINNAGIIQVAPYENQSMDDFRRAMDVHLWGPLNMIRATLPALKAQGGGRIVNISSFGGLISMPHLLPYSASKFALTGLSDGFRAELEKHNIFVTTVCPGTVRTGSIKQAVFKGDTEGEYKWFALAGSMPGLSTDAEAMAHQILEACRDGKAWLIYPWHMRLAVILHALFPEISAWARARAAELLPEPAPQSADQVGKKGFETESSNRLSRFTVLSEQSARRNNELLH